MTDARLSPRLRHRLGALVTGPGWRRILLLRRTAALSLALLALVLASLPSAEGSGVPLVVAAVDLTAGATVVAADLAVREWPADLVPTGAVRDTAVAQGRVVIGNVRAGEPITDVRLVGAGPTPAAGPDGAAVPVRLADAGVAALLVPGSRVDVVTLGPGADGLVLAADATVLAVLREDPGSRGRLVMVAMPRATATRVAAASLTDQVAVTLRSPD